MHTRAYFDDIHFHILRELSKATTSIHIAVAWFTDPEIFDHLCQKAREGIRVELIVVRDSINLRSGLEYKSLTDCGGIYVMVGDKRKRSAIMHNKFCVIDGITVITGSYNWSRQAQENWENITIIGDHPELAREFLAEFERIIGQNRGDGADVDQMKIIGRLEALRHVLELDDGDDIRLQLTKLQKLVPGGDEYAKVRNILTLVEEGLHEQAADQISSFVNVRKQVIVYTDPEIPSLTLELEALKIQISALEAEKAEIEKTLHAFNYRYNTEVGHIVLRLLRLRQDRLKTEADEQESKRQEYEGAKQDYEGFEEGYQETLKREFFAVTEAEQEELRAMFRACSKMCHPDVVAEEYKQEATDLFAQLNAANEKNDIAEVKRIYERLQKGIFTPMNATVSDAQKLHWQIVRLRGKVKNIAVAIYEFRNTDAWRKVSAIADWDDYFAQLRQQLQAELDKLEVQ
jgi:predicted metal-binding protein